MAPDSRNRMRRQGATGAALMPRGCRAQTEREEAKEPPLMIDRANIGDAPRRREDARFVTGHGAYLDDLRFEGVAHAVFLRSPHAHARINAIDTAAALAMPRCHRRPHREARPPRMGSAHCGLRWRPMSRPTNRSSFLPQPLLAEDTVRYAGEPIALVVAETRNQALDAAERIVIEFEPLPAVTRARDALEPGAPELSAEVPGNLCLDWHWGQTAEVADAIRTRPARRDDRAEQPPYRYQSDGTPRRGRSLRRSLHAASVQPEHPRQP